MGSMQTVINLGRNARDKRSISLKTPVKGVTIVCKDGVTLQALEKLQLYVKGELNAWEVRAYSVIRSAHSFRSDTSIVPRFASSVPTSSGPNLRKCERHVVSETGFMQVSYTRVPRHSHRLFDDRQFADSHAVSVLGSFF